MARSDTQVLLAVAQFMEGTISVRECLHRVQRAEKVIDFACQDLGGWKVPRARSTCACGNELRNSLGPCEQCWEEHEAIYFPNGKRRILSPEY